MPQNLALIIQLCIFSYPELFLDTRLSVESKRARFITTATLDFFFLFVQTPSITEFLQLMDTRVYYPKDDEEKDLGKLYLE